MQFIFFNFYICYIFIYINLFYFKIYLLLLDFFNMYIMADVVTIF